MKKDDDLGLKPLQETWERHAKSDPLWAVLSEPNKTNNRWRIEDFMATGKTEVDSLMSYIRDAGIPLKRRSALDFGCGVGRLTQALAGHFESVSGIDISPRMVALAKEYSRLGSRCNYRVCATPTLPFSDNSLDFVYSARTLQHMTPAYSRRYLLEFLRVLEPAGLLVFQIPSHRIHSVARVRMTLVDHLPTPLLTMYRMIKYRGRLPSGYSMYGVRRQSVVRFLERHGASVIDVRPDYSAGNTWESHQYLVQRAGCSARDGRKE